MAAIFVMSHQGQIKRVAAESAEYAALCDAGWNIDDIIGETDEDIKERQADERRQSALARLDEQVEAVKAAAEAMGYAVKVNWANETRSRYVTCDSYKVRVSDHSACYPCAISVDPDGLDVAQAIEWLRDHKEDEE